MLLVDGEGSSALSCRIIPDDIINSRCWDLQSLKICIEEQQFSDIVCCRLVKLRPSIHPMDASSSASLKSSFYWPVSSCQMFLHLFLIYASCFSSLLFVKMMEFLGRSGPNNESRSQHLQKNQTKHKNALQLSSAGTSLNELNQFREEKKTSAKIHRFLGAAVEAQLKAWWIKEKPWNIVMRCRTTTYWKNSFDGSGYWLSKSLDL